MTPAALTIPRAAGVMKTNLNREATDYRFTSLHCLVRERELSDFIENASVVLHRVGLTADFFNKANRSRSYCTRNKIRHRIFSGFNDTLAVNFNQTQAFRFHCEMTRAIATPSISDAMPAKKKLVETQTVSLSPQVIQAANDGKVVQRKAACACGGDCPRCASQPNRLEADHVASADEHERHADKAADEAVRDAETHAPVSPANLPGDRLPFGLRQHFETTLGHDLSGVRLRTGEAAAAAAHGLSAAAFTTGNEITFGQGQYMPHTHAGRHLLAHELSHVIQQGAAPRMAAAVHAPVRFTGQAPRVQRQDFNPVGGDWSKRPDVIKKLIKDNDATPGKEVSKAIEKNNLKGTPSLFRTEVIDNKTHEWRLTINAAWLDKGSLNPGTKYGITKDTFRYTYKGKHADIEVHEIPIEVNYLFHSTGEYLKLFPKGSKANDEARVNLVAARTIYHELIHAMIRVDEESQNSPQTQPSVGFAKQNAKLKSSPKLAAIEQAVKQSVSRLVYAAEKLANRGDLFAKPGETLKTRAEKIMDEAKADKLDEKYMPNLSKAVQDSIPFANKSDEHVNFLEETMRMLLEEKYARKATGDAFKLKDYQENSKLVDDYVGQIESTVLNLARKKTGLAGLVLAGDKDYDRELSGLHSNVLTMYNLLDTEPEVTPGVGPKMFSTPETFPAPLDMGGNPVR